MGNDAIMLIRRTDHKVLQYNGQGYMGTVTRIEGVATPYTLTSYAQTVVHQHQERILHLVSQTDKQDKA